MIKKDEYFSKPFRCSFFKLRIVQWIILKNQIVANSWD